MSLQDVQVYQLKHDAEKFRNIQKANRGID